MKLLKVGKTKIKCRRKDGKEKWYKAASKVINFAKKAFKTGDEVKATFDDDTRDIVKLVKSNYNNVGRAKSNNDSSQYVNMTERSALASVATIVASLEDVTLDNVKETVKELFEESMTLIKGKAVKTEKDDEEDEEELEEEELDDEDEEEEE